MQVEIRKGEGYVRNITKASDGISDFFVRSILLAVNDEVRKMELLSAFMEEVMA